MSIEEKLINLVQVNEFLYNREAIDYRNNELKDRKWREIAATLRVDVFKVKQRWKSLRDRFMRERTRVRTFTEAGKRPVVTWKYYKIMQFLKSHTKQRLQFEEVALQHDNIDTEMYETTMDGQPCISYETENAELSEIEFKPRAKLFQNSQSQPPTSTQAYEKIGKNNNKSTTKELLSQKIEGQISRLMSHIAKGERQTSQTPVHAFFNAMAVQIEHANLPLSTWFALQQEIMQLINNTIAALNPE